MSSEPENENPAGGETFPPESETTAPEAEAAPPARNRSRRSRGLLLAAAAIILAVALYNALMARTLGGQEVHLYGQDSWTPGLPASLRVVLLRHRDQRPIEGASVRILISRRKAEIVELASGRTDAAGTIEPSFTVPEGEGPARLVVKAESPAGSDFVDRPIRLVPAYRILMASDQPAYRVGQRVRLQVGVSRWGTGEPAGNRAVSLRAFAPGGIPFATRSLRTDEVGGAAAEFSLAPDAPAGAYRIKASVGASAVELSLPVTASPEPPFPVRLGDVARFAVPGGLVRGYVAAQDRLGNSLRGAAARVWLENTAGRTVAWTSGTLDLQGRLSFGLPAPQGDDPAMLRLFAEVTDSALRSARAMQSIAVTPHPIEMIAIPEARALVPGIENRVYLAARYPDGAPARATIRYAIGGTTGTVRCSPLGVATVRVTPGEEEMTVALTASDAHGRTGVARATLPLAHTTAAEWALRERLRQHAGRPENGKRPGPLLIRPDRGLYRPGDVVGIEVLAPGTDAVVYVDGYAAGQTFFSRSATPRGGRTAVKVRLPEAVSGLVRLRAYVLGPWGDAAYTERAVFVLPGPVAKLPMHTDRPVYEPGQTARLAVGPREAGAVGLTIARADGGGASRHATLVIPGALTAPLRPGLAGATSGREDESWRAASDEERETAALAALAQAPPLQGWSLHEDAYARKRAALHARQAASWGWLRWMVLVLLAGLWLVATRVLPQSSGENDGSESNSGALASALRFVTIAMAVAFAATLLFRLVGPDRAPVRGDETAALLKALQQERVKEAQEAARNTPTLPPAVRESVAVRQASLWALATPATDSRDRVGYTFSAPADPGEWLASAVVLSGKDAPARAVAPVRVESPLAVEFTPPPVVHPGDVASVVVRIRNPRPEPQTARLKLMAGAGLGVVGEPIWAGEIPGGAGITRYLRVSAAGRLGASALTLSASGAGRTMMLRREVEVRRPTPDTTVVQAGRATKPITYQVDLDGEVSQASVSFQGTAALAAAQLADLAAALPFSALERAAALDIARMALQFGGSGQSAAQSALERAFQSLLACRDDSGAFAAHPGDKPDAASTAYAVAVLEAAGDAVPGADLVARGARRWLGRQQDGILERSASGGEAAPGVLLTAWALGPQSRAARELRARDRVRGARREDPYVLSLLSLAAGKPEQTESAAGGTGPSSPPARLAAAASAVDAGLRWVSEARTVQGFSGEASAVETTAMAVLALAAHPGYREQVARGVDYLASARGRDGRWGSLFTTSLVLRAAAVAAPSAGAAGFLDVVVNGRAVARLDARHPRADLRARLRQGENSVSLAPAEGEGPFYEIRIAGPDLVPEEPAGAPDLTTDLMPRRLRPGQAVRFTARVAADAPAPARLEIPLPAGFRPVRADLEEMVRKGEALGFHVGARRVWIDVDTGRKRQARWVELRLVAPGPCTVLAPAPVAYSVADPTACALGRALRLVVE